ncbi:uncharacterized protein LOC144118577 [Amblyomma americanum]
MAAKGEARVLYCGFKKIENVDAYFKTSSLVRGRHLYDSNHVYAVREEIVASAAPSEVIGKCAAQMKTAEYEVRLQLFANPRCIVDASCSCKAGCRGWCKHGAALAVFVNNYKHVSCTDLPCT